MGVCMGMQVLGLALENSPTSSSLDIAAAISRSRTSERALRDHGAEPRFLRGCGINPEEAAVEITYMNLNDDTLAGFRCTNLPAFAVQYHPGKSGTP